MTTTSAIRFCAAVLSALLFIAHPARAGVLLDDGLVHDLSDASLSGCEVTVLGGPGGTVTTLNVLPGAVLDSGVDAYAIHSPPGERSLIHIWGGRVTGTLAGIDCQTAGPHSISGGTISGGTYGVIVLYGTYLITGGVTSGPLPAWFRTGAIVSIDGGTMDGDGGVIVSDNARLAIHSGTIRSANFHAVTASHVSTTDIYGGTVTGIETNGSAVVTVHGGSISAPPGKPNAIVARGGTVHVRGGSVQGAPSGGLELITFKGTINIYGSQFDYPEGPLPPGDGVLVNGRLEDGTHFSWRYSNLAGGVISLVRSVVGNRHSTWGSIKSVYGR